MATAEKAVFDACYLAAAHGGAGRELPELFLDDKFKVEEVWGWVEKIPSLRLSTMTAGWLKGVLEGAEMEGVESEGLLET